MEEIHKLGSIAANIADDLFLASASFEEERCKQAVSLMSGYRTNCAVVADMTSKVSTRGGEKQRRARGFLLKELARVDSKGLPRTVSVGGSDYLMFWRLIDDELRRRQISFENMRATIDISCLTRLQLFVLVKKFATATGMRTWRLLYTRARSYNSRTGDKFSRLAVGGFESHIVPISAPGNRRKRIAIVLLGHEGQRTFVSWQQADPDETFLFLPRSEDSRHVETCMRENKVLLGTVRSPPREVDPLDAEGFSCEISELLARFCGGGVGATLIPFGPKPLVVGAALGMLAVRDRVGIDVGYAVPRRYNPDYSEGVSGTFSWTWECARS